VVVEPVLQTLAQVLMQAWLLVLQMRAQVAVLVRQRPV